MGFDVNTFVGLTSDADRYDAMSFVRGVTAMMTIKKWKNDTFVNYHVTGLSVLVK